jgi:hypothetical protein
MATLATRRRYRATAAIAALVLLLTAVVVPLRFVHAQSDAIAGDYAVTLVYGDIPTDVANGSMGIGHWKVSFASDGTFTEERLDLGVLVTGSYELNGDQLIVTDMDGLLSCGNVDAAPGGDTNVASATYTFKLNSRNLTLTPKDDPCPLRRVIFSTRAFTHYVACITGAATPVAAEAATPYAEATKPVDESGLDILKNLGATPEPAGGTAGTPTADVTAQIDTLLKQMTACWATGDPARFLPLLSNAFQAQFLSGTEQQNLDALNSLKAAMQLQIVWERAGDIDQTADTQVEAVVRTSAADQEEYTRYIFVKEDGTWRWDGTTA